MRRNDWFPAGIVFAMMVGLLPAACDNPHVAEAGILLFGVPAFFLVGFKEAGTRRWAYVLGCLGQPFWYITAAAHAQWGMLILVTFYTCAWINGFYQHWIKKEG